MEIKFKDYNEYRNCTCLTCKNLKILKDNKYHNFCIHLGLYIQASVRDFECDFYSRKCSGAFRRKSRKLRKALENKV